MLIETKSEHTAHLRFGSGTAVPVIILGGSDNALSIARVLGRRGVSVFTLNVPTADVGRSRFVTPIRLPADVPLDVATTDFLLGEASRRFDGCVLLAASDAGLEILAKHREELQRRFLLDLSDPIAQERMLDKQETYLVAAEHDVPTPLWWTARTRDEIATIRDELVYPLIVKPRLSHLFQAKFDSKFIVAHNYSELEEAFAVTEREGIEVLLCEQIPGPDSQLCSYYTYLDENGAALFDFTKRIIRRTPKNMGLACYHITDHVPEIHDLALRLFRGAGLRGLANAEFKLDPRDGVYKLIECNARFTAANVLVHAAGMDLASLVYNRLVDLPLPPLDSFRAGVRLWDPVRDLRAYRELNRLNELSFLGWLRGIAKRQVFPSFQLTDPMPAWNRLRKRIGKHVK
jgi:predicted ATP-grasp superfamily ATP-dependent carboligase